MKTAARKPQAAAIAPLPPGTVLLRCRMDQRAVPWSAPMIGKGRPVKEPRLIAWQQMVGLFARTSTKLREPYAGPVEVRVTARFRKGPIGDCTNLLKSIEDALQGVVFLNDRQVVRNSCERSLAGYDLVTIEVKAAVSSDDAEW